MSFWSFMRDMLVFDWLFGHRKRNSFGDQSQRENRCHTDIYHHDDDNSGYDDCCNNNYYSGYDDCCDNDYASQDFDDDLDSGFFDDDI